MHPTRGYGNSDALATRYSVQGPPENLTKTPAVPDFYHNKHAAANRKTKKIPQTTSPTGFSKTYEG